MPDEKVSQEELKHLLADSLGALTERERKIISLRYNNEGEKLQTLEQISNVVGVTKERIRQIIVKCIRKMRKYNEIKNLKNR